MGGKKDRKIIAADGHGRNTEGKEFETSDQPFADNHFLALFRVSSVFVRGSISFVSIRGSPLADGEPGPADPQEDAQQYRAKGQAAADEPLLDGQQRFRFHASQFPSGVPIGRRSFRSVHHFPPVAGMP
jgi:hypothetical protein